MREAWIVAGVMDGMVGFPRLGDEICGVPHGLRLACDLALAGAKRIFIIWNADGPAPDLSAIAQDPRLARLATLEVVRQPPPGAPDDVILLARADRLFHRDMPKRVLAARVAGIGKIRGSDHDAVLAVDRTTASHVVARAPTPGGIAAVLATSTLDEAELPYAGFTARASGPRSLRRAERQLVWSLRKSADGIAAKAINRRLSLPISRVLAPTRVHPNHVTLVALALALTGAAVIAQGGYLAGIAGMLLVELGSIVDGIDGELARLRFQFSRTGQWLDTVVDDLANVAYVSACALSLDAPWAYALAGIALTAFTLTQSTQYVLIRYVYKSGDLAAIPWAFQSADSLSRTGFWATLPKLLKRDFVVTLFVAFAIAGRLDLILVVFATGALVFFCIFFFQLARNWKHVERRAQASRS